MLICTWRTTCKSIECTFSHMCCEVSLFLSQIKRFAKLIYENGILWNIICFQWPWFHQVCTSPSVTVLCDVPVNIDSSFCWGQVLVGLNNVITEPSSSMRHSAKLYKLFAERNIESPVMLIYTDGGPDHNTTCLLVELGIIALLLQHNLGMIEAVKTTPYHYWKNPRERVNSILNLGLQADGLMRSTMEEKYKKVIFSCSSVQDVWKQFEESAGLKEALQDSVQSIKILVHSLFSRLKVKDKPMLSYAFVSDHEVEAFADILCDIEPDLEGHHATNKDLKEREWEIWDIHTN